MERPRFDTGDLVEAQVAVREKNMHRSKSEAQYKVVDFHAADNWLLIRDVGTWDKHRTITNDAEGVVARLAATGYLPEGRKLFYYDSNGEIDEIVVSNGRFVEFKPTRNFFGPTTHLQPGVDL